jgi:hypothetical protein
MPEMHLGSWIMPELRVHTKPPNSCLTQAPSKSMRKDLNDGEGNKANGRLGYESSSRPRNRSEYIRELLRTM